LLLFLLLLSALFIVVVIDIVEIVSGVHITFIFMASENLPGLLWQWLRQWKNSRHLPFELRQSRLLHSTRRLGRPLFHHGHMSRRFSRGRASLSVLQTNLMGTSTMLAAAVPPLAAPAAVPDEAGESCCRSASFSAGTPVVADVGARFGCISPSMAAVGRLMLSFVVNGGSMTDFFGDDRGDDDQVSHFRGRPFLLLVLSILQSFSSPKSAFHVPSRCFS
jgi:hypothetical protein